MGTLFIVATPIGNLQDITFRALSTLGKVEYIACEDTRRTGQLIREYFKGKEKEMLDKLFSYYEQVEEQKNLQIINLLKNGKNIALVSDAGTPTISDPGFKLVREARLNNINVVSIPGPSSVISALASSGLPTDKFIFLGFLPQKPGHRIKFLEKIKESQKIINSTIILFESPYKLIRTLSDIQAVLGDIEVVIAKEITKIHEEFKKENISKLLIMYEKKIPKGEITLLLNLK